MSTSAQNPEQEKPEGGDETFTTDVSETDDEGTTIREAEVREGDLTETKPGEGPTSRESGDAGV
jgi:hypothetical protein